MWRKRASPAPAFRQAAPFSPVHGAHAQIGVEGIFPYCAMMQIAAEDTYQDYVICRGFDIRIGRFVDYESGSSANLGISVAKPYGKRRKGVYRLAHIYPALLPTQLSRTGFGFANPSPSDVPWRVGQNPGVAATSTGQPASLSETINELIDHNGDYVNYMLLDGTSNGSIECCFKENHPGRGVVFEVYKNVGWDPDDHRYLYDTSDTDTISKAIDWWCDGTPDIPNAGARAYFHEEPSTEHGTIMVLDGNCDCDSPGSCDDEGTTCGENP